MNVASLELTGISKSYPGVQALRGVSFSCGPGEIRAVLGENGSGKSTLLGIASGAVAPDAGRVVINGRPLQSTDPLLARRLGLATVYQDDSLIRELTVAENLFLAAVDAPLSLASVRRYAKEKLAPHGLNIEPDALVGDLTPAQRQFLEIVKAVSANPKVLLLDEPTSSLDLAGVEKLSAIIRRVTAEGTAVVYVSHRLHEILALADRVTILRDGEDRGTYDINAGLSESDLVALMIGRPIETEHRERVAMGDRVAMWATRLSGARFQEFTFHVHRGEILGFAGAEGNGQRNVIRALGGLEEASGRVFVAGGASVRPGAPREALTAGILSLSADRSQESLFPALGVRENITIQALGDFAVGGLVSSRREQARAASLVDDLDIVTPTLDQPVGSLSGGNQQKTVLARSFLGDARTILIDEPTQGVDANARFDIYRAIRAKAEQGVACVVNSSDALELAGLCDRVLVFSRGRVIRELRGSDITEESIVSSFLRSRDTADSVTAPDVRRATGRLSFAGLRKLFASGGNRWWVPLAFLFLLIVVVGGYAALRSNVFLTPINIRHILLATAPLALVTLAQFNVLMVRGFDISVGALMSLTVVLASFIVAAEFGPSQLMLGILGCLLVGVVAGYANGALVRFAGINSVITTIAMLSLLQGFAFLGRPSPFGAISTDFTGLLQTRVGSVPLSFFVIVAGAIAADVWLYFTRSGLKLRAVGFREEAAKRNGVRINFVHVRAYVLSAVLAVLAGFFLSSEVGFGHPTVGANYTLTSIAAAVLGGAALTGGRGSYVGAVLGALFFTLTLNIITLLGLNTGAGIIISGALTLFAVMLYSGWRPVGQIWARLNAFVRRPFASAQTS
ncbi:MAG: ATP-binding cassette domain-containing protein [Cucumibacter sp.]